MAAQGCEVDVLRAQLSRRDAQLLVQSSRADKLCKTNDELEKECSWLRVNQSRLQDALAAERASRKTLEDDVVRLEAQIDESARETAARERSVRRAAIIALCRERHARMTSAEAAEAAEAPTTKRARLLPCTGAAGGTGIRDARALEAENANLSSWMELLVDRHLDRAAH